MRKRSITDTEISLIKAMLNRGLKNKEIQFFFNRPDRPVNSGRITGIMNGSYSNSLDILASDNKKLDEFLSNFQRKDVSVSMSIPSALTDNFSDSPLDTTRLQNFFTKDDDEKWMFKFKESDQHECKESFGFKHAGNWLKPIAAFSNNRGGYIFFGIRDSDFQVIGLQNDEFETTDIAEFSKKIKSLFDPTPKFEKEVFSLDNLKVGVIYVEQHDSRPIIATKAENKISEGDIFFRYPGQSAKIKYSDLRAMLDERDRHARSQILPMIEKLVQIGPDNAMVADLCDGQLADEKHNILISDDLIERIKFIKEGQFNEKDGAETLKLVGDVKPVSTITRDIKKPELLKPSDVIEGFLQQYTPDQPTEYIRCAVELGHGAWLPIHYYAHKANMNKEQLVHFIEQIDTSFQRKWTFKSRAKGLENAATYIGGEPLKLYEQIALKKYPEVGDSKNIGNIGRALTLFSTIPTFKLEEMLLFLNNCYSIVKVGRDADRSAFRKGLARLDELYFASYMHE